MNKQKKISPSKLKVGDMIEYGDNIGIVTQIEPGLESPFHVEWLSGFLNSGGAYSLKLYHVYLLA